MRRALALPVLAFLLLATGACTDKSGSSTAAADSTCKELLGDTGLTWLESRTGGPEEIEMKSTEDLEQARSLFYQQVGNWDPDSTGTPSFLTAEMCKVRADVSDSTKQLDIQYGPSLFPFDSPFDKGTDGSTKLTVTAVGSDAKLVYGNDRDGTVRYRVYVKCTIPKAPAKQENAVPIEGQLTDTLTGETSTRVHLTRLLHSARVMAKTFDCQNNPVVPAEPPASVT